MSALKVKPSGVIGGLIGLVGFSVLAGVLVTAMVTPALAVTSSAAKGAIGLFDNLPDYIQIGGQSQRNEIYALRAGAPVPIATVYDQNRQEVAWDGVSQFVKDAAVAGEDRRFYQHGGVDLQSLLRAGVGFVTKTGTTGGSTLAMQLVKNIRVQQALQEDTPAKIKAAYADAIKASPDRKLAEMKLAIGLEKRYTKNQILLAYLNITGFGGVTYGIEAAAERYFSVSAKDVTLAQAASLVAIVQQPNDQRLDNPAHYPVNKLRRDIILGDMLELGKITQKQHDEAVATPIASYIKLSLPNNGCLNAADAKFFCDYVVRNVTNLTALGASKAERAANWTHGGYKIYTSLDLDQQDVAQAQINKTTPNTETRFALGSAAIAMEPGTGKILVMAQNKDYNNTKDATAAQTSINYSTDQAYGGSTGFQTGSTYKVFTLTDWLQNGHGLQERVDGTPRTFAPNSFKCKGQPTGSVYSPKNDSGGEGGSRTVLSATTNSVNVAFVAMAQKLDLCDIRDDATAMGVHRADGKELEAIPSSTLGTNQIAPLSMAGAIATIGAGGVYCAPTAVDKVVAPDGKELPGQEKNCTQAIDPKIAATVAYALKTVFTAGTATSANPRDGVDLVGKTGTTDGSYQNWLIGTTTKVALAVWVGNIQGNPAKRTAKNLGGEQSLRQISVAGSNGYSLKFTIFKTAIKSLNANPAYKGGSFPAPDSALLAGRSAIVPSVVGQSPAAAQALLTSLQFNYADGGPEASAQPAGVVSRTDPPAGTSTSLGQTVTVYTSDGSLATTMPNVVGLDLQKADSTIASYGFNPSNITYTWIAGSPGPGANQTCTVASSNPAAGAAASKQDPITLTVYGKPDGTEPGGGACPH
ncbi:transglycosylase domain-containing protein [Lacisediminihabitans sp.]|uniref:transglycosylase domain-containing protein n=1 Tax=Lacisediminihabitans sp. TaxID=2787631 RepID=UPI002F9413B1